MSALRLKADVLVFGAGGPLSATSRHSATYVIGLRIVGALTASTSSARRRSHPQPSRRTELSTERDGEVRILLPLLFAETCVTLDQLVQPSDKLAAAWALPSRNCCQTDMKLLNST